MRGVGVSPDPRFQAAPAVEGLWIGALERVDCETGEPVDDIRVRPKSGPTQIPSAWAHLNCHADSMAKNRAGTDVSGLQQYLTSKQLRLVGVVEFQAAVAKLKQLTARELDRLDGGPVAIPGPSGDISISRAIIAEVEVAAAAGPVLVTGEPGSGKTVSVHHLARSIQAAGGEVAFLAVGNVKAGSLGELHNELGLGSPLDDVLAQWAPGMRKTLVIDSLDAARRRAARLVALLWVISEFRVWRSSNLAVVGAGSS